MGWETCHRLVSTIPGHPCWHLWQGEVVGMWRHLVGWGKKGYTLGEGCTKVLWASAPTGNSLWFCRCGCWAVAMGDNRSLNGAWFCQSDCDERPVHIGRHLRWGDTNGAGEHQQTLGALPGSTVVLIDGIVIHSTYSVCRNVYELRSAPVVLL